MATNPQMDFSKLLGDNLMVQCFYKGTPFPLSFSGTQEQWAGWKDCMEQSIVQGLRGGHSLPDQVAHATRQMNLMEKTLFALGKSAGDGVINKSRWQSGMATEFIAKCGEGGLPISCINGAQALWFMNVHLLIRSNTIKDDNMNGWIMMGGTSAQLPGALLK